MKTGFAKKLGQAAIGTAVAGSMLAATPAAAQGRYDRDLDGISAGEVVAGAVVIGGLAALLGSLDQDDRRDGRYGYRSERGDRRWYEGSGSYGPRYGGARSAIQQCVNTVEGRYRGRNVDVVDIRNIDRSPYGYNVRGRVTVEKRNSARRAYRADAGSFVCRVQYGKVAAVDYNGIRGL